MTCKEVQRLFPDYLRGKLSDEEMSIVARHLHQCNICPKELSSVQQLYNHLGALQVEGPDDQYWQTLLPRIHQRIGERSRYRVAAWIPRYVLPLAVVAAIAIAVLETVSPPGDHREVPASGSEEALPALLREISAGELLQIAADEALTVTGAPDLEGDADILRGLIDTASVIFLEPDGDDMIAAQLTDQEMESIVAYLDRKQFTR